jgi:dTDP-glucose pyrophosphorylase
LDKNKDNTRVLILSAGKIPIEMQKFFGKICSGLIPINGKPIIFNTIDNLIDHGYHKITITVGYNKKHLMKIINSYYQNKVKIDYVEVDWKKSPGNSIIKSLKKIKENKLLVILGDTVINNEYFKFLNKQKDFVIASKNFSDSSKWCVVETKNKELKLIYDKKRELKLKTNFAALIGVYFFSSVKVLKNISKKNQYQKKIEISLLLESYKKNNKIIVKIEPDWYDVGHKNNYFNSKKELLQSRFFNYLELDEKNGIVTKKSQNVTKLKNEINWYKSIPNQIKVITPKIISSKTNNKANLVMEHIDFSTLTETWLYGNISYNNWKSILNELKNIIITFKKYKKTVYQKDYEQIYIKKTQNRVQELISSNPTFRNLFNYEDVKINGKLYKNWNKLSEKIFPKIEKIFCKEDNCLIHGDLCFSNILYDVANNQYRIIDPRGKWGNTIFGDIKYDLAKLRHSIVGGYDSINNGLFSIECNNNSLKISTLKPVQYQKVSNDFDLWVSKNWNLEQIKMIEGLLFISMLPLHNDDLKKQLAFFAIGIQRLNEIDFTKI